MAPELFDNLWVEPAFLWGRAATGYDVSRPEGEESELSPLPQLGGQFADAAG